MHAGNLFLMGAFCEKKKTSLKLISENFNLICNQLNSLHLLSNQKYDIHTSLLPANVDGSFNLIENLVALVRMNSQNC